MAASEQREVVAKSDVTDYVAFTRRILRALGRRVGDEADIAALAELAELERDIQAVMLVTVDKLKETYSWADVARELGTNRSAAHERFGPKSLYRQRDELAKAAKFMARPADMTSKTRCSHCEATAVHEDGPGSPLVIHHVETCIYK